LEYSGTSSYGYVCSPHESHYDELINCWKKSDDVINMYFVTATFSEEILPYFPNEANHYILASFVNPSSIHEKIKEGINSKLTFIFNISNSIFEKTYEKLNYISIYFMKYSYGANEMSDIANIIARRDRVSKASLADVQLVNSRHIKFAFPYSKNVLVLEVDGDKTHQSDQKYCERTRRDVVRRGIALSNLISLSILEKLK
jgi:hypothetical protein